MKKNRKISKNFKSKLAILSLAAVLPLATTGMMASIPASADSSSTSYVKSYVQEVSLSNSNFNSSSSSSALNTSPSGWASQLSDKKNPVTAGVINTGSSFQNYMTGTLYLAKNPYANGADSRILMINSRTANSGNYSIAREGFRSNSVSLSANSYYSFQVAFKTDTNYKSVTDYVIAGTIEQSEIDNFQIGQNTFKADPVKSFVLKEERDEATGETKEVAEDVYISFYHSNRNYYFKKTLNTQTTLTLAKKDVDGKSNLENIEYFYEDENFFGFIYDDGTSKTPVYVKKEATTPSDEEDSKKININENATGYTCNDLTFVPNSGSTTIGMYKPASTEDYKVHYYSSKTVQQPLNGNSRGSIYLDGLKDKDGNDVQAEYVGVISKDWVTFYFFVATGNESQTVNLELWLGAKQNKFGTEKSSSGVVFFDDIHINQYSENAFWKAYQNYCGLGYDLSYDKTESVHQNCTNLIDLRESKALSYKDLSIGDEETNYNFDFEEGEYHDSATSLKYWDPTAGSARVFSVNSPTEFKSKTKGYNFVGSNLACDVELDETGLKVKVDENNYVLGLWADNSISKVTSQEIKIERQKVYKISAQYKISELTDGKAYMFVQEKDTLVKDAIENEDYALSAETSSNGVTSNANNKFINDYGTIEFFVKGNSLYDSSINISLGLGKDGENATGCVVFDNVQVELSDSASYDNATNKLTLGTSASSPTITNGEFDLVTAQLADDGLYAPQNWTIAKENGYTFSGVINTDKNQYQKYAALANSNQQNSATAGVNNPYYWASFPNPGNSSADNLPENVLLLGNMANSSQKLTSSDIDISANTTQKIAFKYRTNNFSDSTIKLSVIGENGFKLYESELSDSTGKWSTHEIYFSAFPSAMKIHLEFDFVTKNSSYGIIYLDNFSFESSEVSLDGQKNVVDMSNLGINVPTLADGEDLQNSTSAFKGANTSGIYGEGKIVNGSDLDKDKSPFYKDTLEDTKLFRMHVGDDNGGAYTITSNFDVDLSADTYYVLSFYVKTYFKYLDEDSSFDATQQNDYGVTFGLTGFKYLTNVVSNDDYQQYRIYINKSSEAKKAKLYMALICNERDTTGDVAIYGISLDPIEEGEFNDAKATIEKKDFDVNTDKVFVSEAEDSTPEDNENQNTENNDATEGNESFNWLLIPTLITALAIVIAVVGYFLRKIKIKKIQIKRRNSYDRKTSANADFIKRKAAEERDNELKALKTSKEKFEKELSRLETEHKNKIVGLREKDKDAVSKETDKEFKSFAKKRTVIAEKIEVLNKQIEEINSPEHLLGLERKIFAEQETIRRKLEKESKKTEKENLKKNQTDKK